MAPQTSAEDHLQEADIGIDVRLLDDLMTWIEKEAKFSSEGIIEDERFTEASKPLFQAVDQGKQPYPYKLCNVLRLASNQVTTMIVPDKGMDLVALKCNSDATIDRKRAKKGILVHVTKHVKLS